jgi:methionyl-tRNA formyltransferase
VVLDLNQEKFNVVITVTEEPLYINPFIKKIISSIPSDIKKIYIIKGSLLQNKNILNKFEYLLTLSIISGVFFSIKRILVLFSFKVFYEITSPIITNPLSIAYAANKYNIPVIYVDDINSPAFISQLINDKPTIIINQAQAILKESLLDIPSIGCLNRHCGLLPKYRGRLSPFWAYTMKEKYSGVSIHFIDKDIDNGPIIIQKKVKIERFDTFNTILEKDFAIAPKAMLEAIDKIKNGNFSQVLIPNPKEDATYYPSPKISDALTYWKVMLKKWCFSNE